MITDPGNNDDTQGNDDLNDLQDNLARDRALKKQAEERKKKVARNRFIGYFLGLVLACITVFFLLWAINRDNSPKPVSVSPPGFSAEELQDELKKALAVKEEEFKKLLAKNGEDQASLQRSLNDYKEELSMQQKQAEAALQARFKAETELAVANKKAEDARLLAEAEAKKTKDAEAAKAKEAEVAKVALASKTAEAKEVDEEKKIDINRMKDEVFDASKNFNPNGQFDVADEDELKKVWAGWIEYKGKYFPLITNPSGNPSPTKGDVAPEFLAPKNAKWTYETIILNNPRGSGSYTTKGWASNMKPVTKK